MARLRSAAGGDDLVVRLQFFQEGNKTRVILRAVSLIDVVSDGVHDADGIKPGATLKTGAGAASELTLHFMLGDKLCWANRNV